MDEPRKPAPSSRWYRLSAVIFALGLLGAAAWWPYATIRVYNAVEAFTRTSRYGGAIPIARPGRYTVWIEGPCLSCAGNTAEEYRRAASVDLRDPAGRGVGLHPLPGDRFYNTGGREGRGLWTFSAAVAGRYRLRLDFDTSKDWNNNLPADVAVGRGVALPRILRPMLLMAAGGAVGALGLAVVTGVRRRRWYDRHLPPGRVASPRR